MMFADAYNKERGRKRGNNEKKEQKQTAFTSRTWDSCSHLQRLLIKGVDEGSEVSS